MEIESDFILSPTFISLLLDIVGLAAEYSAFLPRII